MSFDYSVLSTADSAFLQGAAEDIRTNLKRSAEGVIEVGRSLADVRERIGSDKFQDWLSAEFEMSRSWAYRAIALAERFANPKLGLGLSVLYELAAPSTDEDVVQAVTERAEAGESVSVAEVRRIKLERQEAKRERRDAREAELAAQQSALPEGKSYGVILADPPWAFEVYSQETGMDRSADNHYPTQSLEWICALPVKNLAAPDCVLFLWTTAPHLRNAMRVLTAWEFEYKSSAVWVKDKFGTGYWFRSQHETLLVATRGNPPAPAQGKQWSSVINAPRGRHSEKPESAYDLIEAYYPNFQKIELFARGSRERWDVWGNEAETVPAGNGAVKDEEPEPAPDIPEGWPELPRSLDRRGESVDS